MLLAIISFLVLTQISMVLSIVPYSIVFLFGKLFFHMSFQDWMKKLAVCKGVKLYGLMGLMEIGSLCIIVSVSYWWYSFMEISNKEIWTLLILSMEIFPFFFKCKKLKELHNGKFEKEEITNPIYK